MCVTVWLFSFGYHPHKIIVFYCYDFFSSFFHKMSLFNGLFKKKEEIIKKLRSWKQSFDFHFWLLWFGLILFLFFYGQFQCKRSYSSCHHIKYLLFFFPTFSVYSVKFRVEVIFDQQWLFHFWGYWPISTTQLNLWAVLSQIFCMLILKR